MPLYPSCWEPLSVREKPFFPCLLWADGPGVLGTGTVPPSWPQPPWTEAGEATFSGAFTSCWAAARSVAFFSAMISEKLKTDTLAAFCSLGASAALSCETGATCAGASALSGVGTSGAGCSCLGTCAAVSGWAGAGPEPGPVASVTILLFHRPFAFPPSYLMA